MTLRLYDTASRRVADLVPGTPGQVGIYLCGLTVQAGPHIGHLRSGVNYDVLRRWLIRSGHQVTLVRNLTDIDDKVLAKTAATGVPFWAIAYANELTLAAAYRALRVLPPTYEPRATGHIPDIHELISTLVARGHAYPAVDGCGDVYFDVATHPDYGALSGQRPADVQPSEDGDPRGKRDPRDFALWKGGKPHEPADAHWPSPWGRGRPGWHIECSAMARRYLGDEFDIHGGGLDLIFPHHENELAQSRAAGLGFARYWVHHGLLSLSETKMSKSLGNVLDLDAVTAMGIRPEELRYYLAAPHYRSRMDYSDGALREAAVAYRRLEGFVQRASERVGPGELGPVCAEFAAAMDDDLNTPQALASVHDVMHEGNTAYAEGNDLVLRGTLGSVRAMLDVLGLDPLDPARPTAAGGDDPTRQLRGVVDALVALALEQREAARGRKDFATADAVRDRLKLAGIVVEDTARGPRWTIDGG
ncbi:MAG: cysteine--tRNA ligase [Micromonosporaceae bacterium]|nr:cysteine--tRNA ligase [Micromonosporaceae bacterium]